MEHRRKYTNLKSIDLEKLNGKIMRKEYCCEFATQRVPGQWNSSQKSLLIDSILRGYMIPDIWVCCTTTETYLKYSVIDGVQRITTISDYMNDKFGLSKNLPNVVLTPDDIDGIDEEVEFNIAGKKFSKLPSVLQQIICDYTLTVREMHNFTDDEIEDQLYRLNNGSAMTPSQKLKIMLGGDVAEKIQLIEDLPFWERTKFTKNQIKHGMVCATILQCLMITTGYDYNGFTQREMEKFAVDYADICKEKQITEFIDIITKLDNCMLTTDENDNYLSKANIPALVACTQDFIEYEKHGEFNDDDYMKFLEDWVDHNAKRSGYAPAGEVHTTNTKNVHARIDIITAWLEAYVRNKTDGTPVDAEKIRAAEMEEQAEIFIDSGEPAKIDKNSREYIEGLFVEPNDEPSGKPSKTPTVSAETIQEENCDNEREVEDIEATCERDSEEQTVETICQTERIGA